jgi:hypothetical protein
MDKLDYIIEYSTDILIVSFLTDKNQVTPRLQCDLHSPNWNFNATKRTHLLVLAFAISYNIFLSRIGTC